MTKLSKLNNIQKQNLFAKLRISLTHHSNAIEGLSLTFGETKKLLEKGITANNKPLHEQLLILGFADAFEFVVRESANKQQSLTANFFKDVHAIIFHKALETSPNMVERPVGAWRQDERYIKGVDIALSHPKMIGQDIENLLFNTPSKLSMEDIAKFHIDFEKIHPFSDGNGRVGRLLITYQALQNDYIPPLILNQHRKEYIHALNDKSSLRDFLKEASEESLKLVYQNEIHHLKHSS